MKKFAIWMLCGVLCLLMASLALYIWSHSRSYESDISAPSLVGKTLTTECVAARRHNLKSHTPAYAENPPSTGITMPVTKPDASEASQRAALTRSSGLPNLPIGVWSMISCPR